MSSIVASADAAKTISACGKLFSGGGFRSSNICCLRLALAGFAEGGAGKSEALFTEGGAFFCCCVTRAALLVLTLLLIEGKSVALLIEGGGAARRE